MVAPSSVLVTYVGAGIAAARPATPNIAVGTVGLWWNTDTLVMDAYDLDNASWSSVGGGGGSAYKSYDHAFVNAETYTIPDDANSLNVHSASNGISFTITMPAAPTDGQQITIYQRPDSNTYFTTFSPNTGQSIVGNPGSFSGTAVRGMIVIWNLANSTWYCMRLFQ